MKTTIAQFRVLLDDLLAAASSLQDMEEFSDDDKEVARATREYKQAKRAVVRAYKEALNSV